MCKGQESGINMYDQIPTLIGNPSPQASNEIVEHWRRYMLCKPVLCITIVLHSCIFWCYSVGVGLEKTWYATRKSGHCIIGSVGPWEVGGHQLRPADWARVVGIILDNSFSSNPIFASPIDSTSENTYWIHLFLSFIKYDLNKWVNAFNYPSSNHPHLSVGVWLLFSPHCTHNSIL